jgi:hypothetical protein
MWQADLNGLDCFVTLKAKGIALPAPDFVRKRTEQTEDWRNLPIQQFR